MKPFLLFLLYLYSSVLYGQKSISSIVADKKTHKPIPFAHVFLSNTLLTGTVTNEDGLFKFNNVNDNSILNISHISYKKQKIKISNIGDTIFLQPVTKELNEITVIALSPNAILEKVANSLVQNYSVNDLMYNSFVRVYQYEKDTTELHILSEYLINVYQDGTHDSQYKIVKMRTNAFSKAGKRYLKDMRVIFGITFSTENLFQFTPDFLSKKRHKKYQIKIIENRNNAYKIECLSKKGEGIYFLDIDKATYAIKKIVFKHSEDSPYYKEIGFKQIGNKWYATYTFYYHETDSFKKWDKKSNAVFQVIAYYNLNDYLKYRKEQFKSYVNIVAEPIKYHNGNWNDDFWENYNYIPLPDWIKQIIEKKAK